MCMAQYLLQKINIIRLVQVSEQVTQLRTLHDLKTNSLNVWFTYLTMTMNVAM